MFLLRILNFSNLPITRSTWRHAAAIFLELSIFKTRNWFFPRVSERISSIFPSLSILRLSKPTISHYHVTICKFVQTSTINCDFVIWDPSAPFFRSKTNHSCWSGANQIFSCIVFHVCARVFTFNRRAVKGSIQSMIDTHFWNFLKFFGRSLIFLFLTTLSNTASILQESITSSKIFYNLPLV